MARRRILHVGVELEGGWKKRPPTFIRADGSVNVPIGTCTCGACSDQGDTARYVGEVSCVPSTPLQAYRWMLDNYPDIVNATCGLHVHVSLDPGDYCRLMRRKFHNDFIAGLKDWGLRYPIKSERFWARLDNKNQFCRVKFPRPDMAVMGRTERYCAVNFAAYARHKTLEIRVLPMFHQKKVAVAAIKFCVEFIEGWLADKTKERGDQRVTRIKVMED